MKILITSDVHGNVEALKKVVSMHKDIDYHINAGDMCLDEKHFEQFTIISVKGNNDFRSLYPYERILNLGGLIVYLTHGHQEHVKMGLERLKLKAKLHHANLCIFGHTHQRYLMVEENILFVNPGALGDNQSYAIYEDGQITFMRG
ncbi:MAG: metallophosphoesterase family protein [Acholeplasmataceae bacterium]|nr:metallophosphoesterase family protein [Acholeplasmataceae bacterium]